MSKLCAVQFSVNVVALLEVTFSCCLVLKRGEDEREKIGGAGGPVLAPITTGSVVWPDHFHSQHLNLIHHY